MSTGAGSVMTVLGAIEPEAVGVALVHEHLHMDATAMLAVHGYPTEADRPFDPELAAEARWNPGAHPDNYRLTDRDLIVQELGRYRAAGGRTVVDLTPVELGRDPAALRAISVATGLHVVMGSGHYIAAVHASRLRAESIDVTAARLVAECRHGVNSTGIRPGIIGEIGTSDPLLPGEERVLRAAARASRATGLAVSVHLQPWGSAGEHVLRVLLEEGMAADRIVLGHLTTAHSDDAYLRRLLDAGAHLGFDLFGFDHSLLGLGRYPPSDADVVTTVAGLVEAGYAERILLSQDVGVRTRLHRYGGWGYDHLLHHVVPLLRSAGLGDADVEILLVENPRRVLTVAAAA